MAWENKPLSEYTDNPWGKTIITDVEKPSPGSDGFAHLMQVQYDPATGKRVDDISVFWNLRDLKQEKKILEKELLAVNTKINYVQTAINELPEAQVLPAPPQE